MVVLLPIQHPSHFQQMVVEVGREKAWQDPLGEGVADPNLLRLRKMVEEGAMEPRRLRRHHHHHPLNHPRKKEVEASREMVLIDPLVEEGADPNPLRRQKMVAEGAMELLLLRRHHHHHPLNHPRKKGVEASQLAEGAMEPHLLNRMHRQ